MGKKNSGNDESKHADRKFDKKLKFYAKVRDTVSLGAQKDIKKKKTRVRSRQKKLKAYNLSSLAEFLPDVNIEPSKKPTAADFKVTTKSKQKLVMKESNQLKTVLDDPVFKADPLAALHQHLQSTQPVSDPPKKKTGKNGSKKKKKSKASQSSMEE